MPRVFVPVTVGLGAVALGLAMLASTPVFAEPYPKETVDCKKGMVYDRQKKKCVKAQSSVTPDTVLTGDAYRRAAAAAKG